MDARRRTAISKRLSYHLRHAPQEAGVQLDRRGWADIATLLDGLRVAGRPVTRAELDEVVATSAKQRFERSPDGTAIRARYGHSVPVELGYRPRRPPDTLYHGTVAAALPSIAREGLSPRRRQQVHLSADVTTARAVGARRGVPVVVEVDAAGLVADGAVLTHASAGVWLTDHVPPGYVRLPEDR